MGDALDVDGRADLAATTRIRNEWMKFRELCPFLLSRVPPLWVENVKADVAELERVTERHPLEGTYGRSLFDGGPAMSTRPRTSALRAVVPEWPFHL